MRVASNTERLTPLGGRRLGWVGQLALLGVLLLGPENLARLISGLTSVITFPITRELSFDSNRYEVFNLELLMIYIVSALGLNLLLQTGLISIGTTAPFAFGAYFVGIVTVDHGWNFFLALAAAAVLTGAIGFVLGLPALRMGVFTFAMVTLGYATVATGFALQWIDLTGGGDGFAGITMPKPFDNLNRFYWLLAIVLALAYIVSRNWIRSPFGRSSVAVEASPVAARSVGISPHMAKLWAFSVSSAFAGVAGGLYGGLLGFVAPDSFTLNLAILWLLMVLLGGAGTVAGPIIGAIVLFRIPLAVEDVTDRPGQWSLLAYGAVLILSVHFFPRGIMSGWQWVKLRLSRGNVEEAHERKRAAVKTMLEPIQVEDDAVLRVSGISKNLSGVQALRDVGLTVRPGTVHALIGPNGSGKTTMLNVMSGFIPTDEGTVSLIGRDVTHMTAHRRAQLGLARTFQTPSVFEAAVCRDNVMIALDQNRSHSSVSHLVRLPWARRDERRTYDRAIGLLDSVGLGHRVTSPAGDLPPGERRLLELARVLALEPRIVLMDEPAAGLTEPEIEELEECVHALRESGVAVLLVEHHVDFVLRLADEITVIDFGEVIARGKPDVVRTDPAVIAAYLGQTAEEAEAAEQGHVAALTAPTAADKPDEAEEPPA